MLLLVRRHRTQSVRHVASDCFLPETNETLRVRVLDSNEKRRNETNKPDEYVCSDVTLTAILNVWVGGRKLLLYRKRLLRTLTTGCVQYGIVVQGKLLEFSVT